MLGPLALKTWEQDFFLKNSALSLFKLDESLNLRKFLESLHEQFQCKTLGKRTNR